MSTCILIFHSNSGEHTCDSYGWSIVGSLGCVLYNRRHLFSTSKHPPAGGDREKEKNRECWTVSDTSPTVIIHTHTHRLNSTEGVVWGRKLSELSDTVFLSKQQPVTHSCPYPEWQDWVTDFIIMNSREPSAGCCQSLQLHSYWPQVQTVVIKRK